MTFNLLLSMIYFHSLTSFSTEVVDTMTKAKQVDTQKGTLEIEDTDMQFIPVFSSDIKEHEHGVIRELLSR